MDETYDVYIVMVPSTSAAFDRLTDLAVEWDAVGLESQSITYDEGLALIQRVKETV